MGETDLRSGRVPVSSGIAFPSLSVGGKLGLAICWPVRPRFLALWGDRSAGGSTTSPILLLHNAGLNIIGSRKPLR